jgi:predicted GNAT family acetyltransferase
LARTQGYKIVPQCPFIVGFIEKHPEFRDLIAV